MSGTRLPVCWQPDRSECLNRCGCGTVYQCPGLARWSVGIERRKGRLYEYRRRRVNGRPVKEYVGPIDAAMAAVVRQESEETRQRRQGERLRTKQAGSKATDVLDAAGELDRLADGFFRAILQMLGYRMHHRGEWRKRRGIEPMASARELLCPSKKVVGLIDPASTHPAIQKVLKAAAAGDPAALPAVRDLLKNEFIQAQLGGVAAEAQRRLVQTVAGTHLAVSEATKMQMEKQRKDLLADGGSEVSFAETLAAQPVVHGWLTVHILELQMAGEEPASKAAIAIDKRLNWAQGRLLAALRSLAVLRRLRSPTVGVQVNVAGGHLQVNNARPPTQEIQTSAVDTSERRIDDAAS